MAHGCMIKALQSGAYRSSSKWTVRKRDGIWHAYPPGQCCPASSHWFFRTAIDRAQELARKP
jgi:hypothetical protein